jgi:methanogenic corrinoid protein MtbC1
MKTINLEEQRDNLKISLLTLDRFEAEKIIISTDLTSCDVIEKLVIPVLDEIGSLWEKGIVALSQVYMISRICEEIIELFIPKYEIERKKSPRIGIFVLEDNHILGKRIVYFTVRAAGYDIYDYGIKKAEDLIRIVTDEKLEILLISTLMLSSAMKIKKVTKEIKKILPEIKIFVGGAPFRFSEKLWKTVGADGMGRTASDAVKLIVSKGKIL